MTEDTALEAIRATYADLDRWQSRAQRYEVPQPGSKLALEDALYPWHAISEVARVSLISSGEHLRLARTALEAGELYPSAHFTVLRGALVGACQAVWVLAAGNAADRQERGLMLIDEMYAQLQKYYSEVATTPLSDAQRRDLVDQINWSQERRGQVARARHTAAKLNQTTTITWALDHSFPDDERRHVGRLLWRQMSADAHVLGWSIAQRGKVLRSDPSTGLGVMVTGGDVQQIAEPFLASHLLLRKGWSLFDQLCEA